MLSDTYSRHSCFRVRLAGTVCLTAALVMGLIIFSCKGGSTSDGAKRVLPAEEAFNGIYWWKTNFQPNAYELDFLKENKINKLYVKFFDVVEGSYELIQPIATTKFSSPMPEGVTLVPVVFISADAVKKMTLQFSDGRISTENAAQKIVTRVKNMLSYNELGPLTELQLDCDYAVTDVSLFFDLCRKVKSLVGEDVVLSTTIRLSVLGKTPPVDKGVLMLYNTDSFKNIRVQNSILNHETVELYLNRLKNIDIPLDIAIPAYRWGIAFSGDNFLQILRKADYSDTTLYAPVPYTNRFEVKDPHTVDGCYLLKGYQIRSENSDPEEIALSKELLRKSYPDMQSNIILYHLDSANLSTYTKDEIQSFYSR